MLMDPPLLRDFERVAYSNRGKLLYNQITQSLDSMGHANFGTGKASDHHGNIAKKLC